MSQEPKLEVTIFDDGTHTAKVLKHAIEEKNPQAVVKEVIKVNNPYDVEENFDKIQLPPIGAVTVVWTHYTLDDFNNPDLNLVDRLNKMRDKSRATDKDGAIHERLRIWNAHADMNTIHVLRRGENWGIIDKKIIDEFLNPPKKEEEAPTPGEESNG